jgi:hypothetical protein
MGRRFVGGLVGPSAVPFHLMPRWLPQFLTPLFLVLFVVLAVTLGSVGAALCLLILLVGLVVWRVRDLRGHPSDPELVTKPFWKFWPGS